MISSRLPDLAESIVEDLCNGVADRGYLAELLSAADSLNRSGFVARPDWRALRAGARPPIPEFHEPGERQHGWQYHASSFLEYHFRETVMLRTRVICVPTPAQGQVLRCTGHRQVWSSIWTHSCSAPSFWSDFDSLLTSPMRVASLEALLMRSADTEERAPNPGGFVHALLDLSAH